MGFELDWHTGWEAGPPPLIKPWTTGAARNPHASQDLWQDIGGSLDGIQDITGAGDGTRVHSGRFAFGISLVGVGDATSFSGVRNSPLSTKSVSLWTGWVNLMSWSLPDTLAGDLYALNRVGVQAVGGSPIHLGLGYRIQSDAGPGRFCIIKYNAGGGYNSYTAEVPYDYSAGTAWILWTLNYSGQTATLFIQYSSAGTATASDGTLVGYPTASYVLPRNQIAFTDKGGEGGPKWIYDDWAGGKADGTTASDRFNWDMESQWYQPDGNGSPQLWTPTPAGPHYRNWDPQNQSVDCPTCTWLKPTAVGQDEGMTLFDDDDSDPLAFDPRDARILYDWCSETGAGPPGHNIIVRQSGGAWAVQTPGYGTGSALGSVYCHGAVEGADTFWSGWGSRFAFDGSGPWTLALQRAAEAGLRSTVANNRVGSLGMSMMGTGLTRPGPNLCPEAQQMAAARQPIVQPWRRRPQVVSYHHH